MGMEYCVLPPPIPRRRALHSHLSLCLMIVCCGGECRCIGASAELAWVLSPIGMGGDRRRADGVVARCPHRSPQPLHCVLVLCLTTPAVGGVIV